MIVLDFSQLFLIQTYIYAKKNNWDFYISSKKWSYKYDKGWLDYFKSKYEYKHHKNIEFFSHRKVDNIPNYTLKDYTNGIKDIFQLNNVLLNDATNMIKKLGDYKAVYIRRGDKLISEAKYISVNDILDIINIKSGEKLFVQTDDFNVIKEIKNVLPDIKIYSTVPQDKYGSYHSDYWKERDTNKSKTELDTIVPIIKKLPKEIKKDTDELLIGVYICANAKECWVDRTSNISRFIKLYSNNKVYTYPNDIKLEFDIPYVNPAFKFQAI